MGKEREEREPIAWITRGGKHIPIFADEATEDEKKKEREIAENKKQADEKNETPAKFKDGDTPKVIDVNATYTVEKVALDDSKDANYGQLSGQDTKDMLKGFHYEELVPGDGMWYKDGVKYGYDVRRV